MKRYAVEALTRRMGDVFTYMERGPGMVAGMLSMMFGQLDQPKETWVEVLSETDGDTRELLQRVLGVMGEALAQVEASEA